MNMVRVERWKGGRTKGKDVNDARVEGILGKVVLKNFFY